MAVAFDAAATGDVTSNSATLLDLATLTIGPGANGLTVLIQTDGLTPTSVHWDSAGSNQLCPLIIGQGTVSDRAFLYGLVAPTTGNKNLHVIMPAGGNTVVFAVSWTGVDQTGGATTFRNANSATGSSTTASVAITSASGNAVVASHVCRNTISATSPTNLYIENAPTNVGGTGNYSAGAATVTLTATLTSAAWASVGCDILAAAGTTLLTIDQPFVVAETLAAPITGVGSRTIWWRTG